MRSGEAFGWLIADLLVHNHLSKEPTDVWDERYYLSRGLDPDYVTTFCPECCGPCGALRDYFNTPRGRAEADSFARHLPAHYREWENMRPDGTINWEWVEDHIKMGFCPNHDYDEKG